MGKMTEESGSDNSETIKSFLWGKVNFDIMRDFAECQELGNCACRTNNFVPGYCDKSHSDMENDPKYTKCGYELRDREY